MLSAGIVGLPNVGKSTLFNALLQRQVAEVGEYPFTTVKPNFGVVAVPDERLEKLAALVSAQEKHSVKVVPAALSFVDVAGLVKGAHQGEGLGNEFLAHVREVSVILHLLRLFENPQVPAVSGKIDPVTDKETVELELILKDLSTVERVLGEEKRAVTPEAQKRKEVLQRVKGILEKGKMVREIGLPEEEVKFIADLQLLTLKPLLYVLNIAEGQIPQAREALDALPFPALAICAKLEAELSELPARERKQYLATVGLEHSALDQVIRESFKLLDLLTFFTIKGGKQAQAWPLRKGSTALKAAHEVHSEFAKKFVRAEVIACEKLLAASSWTAAKERGLAQTVGRDHAVQDGEVIEFKHQ